MYLFISILILVICIILGLIVLVQNPKGGGLAANFSGGAQFMGARQTADFLEKASWGLGAALLVLSLVASTIIPRNTGTVANQQNLELQKKLEKTEKPNLDFVAPPVQQPAATTTEKTAPKKKK